MTFPLRIFAIDREIFVGDAKSITLPSTSGEIQILPEHAPLVSSLKEGNVSIEDAQGKEQTIPIAGGTVEVGDQSVTVLVDFS